MEEYKLIKKDEIERIMQSIKNLKDEFESLTKILQGEATLTLGDNITSKGQEEKRKKIKIAPFRKKGPTLASIIYDNVHLSSFTPKQAYELIADIVQFDGERPRDSVRTALKNDTRRFRKVRKGLYQKIE